MGRVVLLFVLAFPLALSRLRARVRAGRIRVLRRSAGFLDLDHDELTACRERVVRRFRGRDLHGHEREATASAELLEVLFRLGRHAPVDCSVVRRGERRIWAA